MAIESWHNKPRTSREIEHEKARDTGLARAGGCAKNLAPPVLHPGFASRTDTSIGAPPTGAPPDASAPNPLDPTRTKQFEIPEASWDMKGGDGQTVDKTAAHRIVSEAPRGAADFAKNLHTKLPEGVTEET